VQEYIYISPKKSTSKLVFSEKSKILAKFSPEFKLGILYASWAAYASVMQVGYASGAHARLLLMLYCQ
jgi:hypothetical protein